MLLRKMAREEELEVPEYEDALTPEEEQELLEYMGSGNYPKLQEQTGIVGLFSKVLKSPDTTKASFLTDQEVEAVRILKSTAEYAEQYDLDKVAEYIRKKVEDVLATALSRKGFFLQTAVTNKRQLSTESKINKEGKSKWLERKQG